MSLTEKLKANDTRNQLYHHRLFDIPEDALTRDAAGYLLGQYWYPLHYFPTFLASLTAKAPDTSFKCAIADILNEELGCGDASLAHENIYIDTFCGQGFTKEQLIAATPSTATTALLECYKRGSEDFLVGLGGVYATESTDLAIVSGIGKILAYVSPVGKNDWIDIHLQQEPNHVKQTDFALGHISEEEERQVITYAEEMWQSWITFFDDVMEQTLKLAENEKVA